MESGTSSESSSSSSSSSSSLLSFSSDDEGQVHDIQPQSQTQTQPQPLLQATPTELEPVSSAPPPPQPQQPQEGDDDDDDEPLGENEYVVERVLNTRVVGGVRQYFLKWLGYGMEDCTWEREEDMNCDDLIDDYWASVNKERPKKKKKKKSRTVNSDSDYFEPRKKKTKRTGGKGSRKSSSEKKKNDDYPSDSDKEMGDVNKHRNVKRKQPSKSPNPDDKVPSPKDSQLVVPVEPVFSLDVNDPDLQPKLSLIDRIVDVKSTDNGVELCVQWHDNPEPMYMPSRIVAGIDTGLVLNFYESKLGLCAPEQHE